MGDFSMMQEISSAIDAVLGFLKSIPLSTASVEDYRVRYRAIQRWCKSRNTNLFSHVQAQEYTDFQLIRLKKEQIGDRHFRMMRRAAYLLADCTQGIPFTWKRVVSPDKTMSEQFINTLIEYRNFLSTKLAPSTIQVVSSMIRQFLLFLMESGARFFCQLTPNHVKMFMQSMSVKRPSKMADLVWAMKGFISFLNERALAAVNVDRHLIRPAPCKKKVLPCFTSHEINAILSAVDTSTAMGKRDYAILVLAIETGLRGVDIFDLKLKDIDWRKREITVVQSKTGEPIKIPLLSGVGNAIATYILYARPKTNSTHIFLRSLSPHIRLGNDGNGNNIISRYLVGAGIAHEAWDGKTFHAFRRTSGTRMLEAEVPLTTVAELLGHKAIDSTKRYISYNDDKMRDCCLRITEYKTRKDGLA
jgi:integrase